MWDIPQTFTRTYLEDHRLIFNELIDQRTSWSGKYTVVYYSSSVDVTCKRCELHQVDKDQELHGHWNDIPDIFLPSILDLCLNIIQEPPENVLKQISLLAWVPSTS